MATILEHLVKGEVMQMRSQHMAKTNNNGSNGSQISRPLGTPAVDSAGTGTKLVSNNAFEHYLRKNYHKTGSLMANSCRAAMVLGRHSVPIQTLGFGFGKHMYVSALNSATALQALLLALRSTANQ